PAGRRARMARLFLSEGPRAGQQYLLEDRPTTLGRQPGVAIVLDAPEVSRQHARVTPADGRFFLEDLGSSNGTYLNGTRLCGKAELRDRDDIQIGPFRLLFDRGPSTDPELCIRAQLPAETTYRALAQEDASRKLLAVLEVTRQLARNLELDELL